MSFFFPQAGDGCRFGPLAAPVDGLDGQVLSVVECKMTVVCHFGALIREVPKEGWAGDRGTGGLDGRRSKGWGGGGGGGGGRGRGRNGGRSRLILALQVFDACDSFLCVRYEL